MPRLWNRTSLLMAAFALFVLPGHAQKTLRGPAGTGSGGLLKRIAVVDFINKTEYGKGRLGIAAADILEGELQRSGKFTVVTHSGLDEVLDLQAIGQSGIIDKSKAVKAGKVAGANAIVNGVISEFGIKKSGFTVPGLFGTKSLMARCTVDITLIDGTTGVVLLSETGKGQVTTKATRVLNIGGMGTYDETLAGKSLRSAIETLVKKIIGKMDSVPWKGYVLKKQGQIVWLGGGKDVGLVHGMQFVVRSLPKNVTAPDGKIYSLPGKEKGRIAITRVMREVSQGKIMEGEVNKDDLLSLVQ